MKKLPLSSAAPRPDHSSPWIIVLAGGCGTRLRGLTRVDENEWVPKQYCSLSGGLTLLQGALDRAATIAHRDRILVVVTGKHRRWWSSLLRTLPSRNILVQPEGRGTANGILLPVLDIAKRETDACIAIMPSDHDVPDETPLRHSLLAAARYSRKHPEFVSLLGIEPGFPDPDLGYILPQGTGFIGPAPVQRFVEKPSLSEAAQLLAAGSLWNAFIMVGAVQGLLGLFGPEYARARAVMLRALASGDFDPNGAHAGDYAGLVERDFSRHILRGQEDRLRVWRVPACGWSDLGTVDRVASALRRFPSFPLADPPADEDGTINLAARYHALGNRSATAGSLGASAG